MGKDQELLEAARNGNIPVVEKILGQKAKRSGPLASLRRGPGANVQDSSGYSSLHHAALNGHKEVVRLLLSHEASTNIVDGKGSSPLHLAAWTGNVDIVRLLLCHGPSVPNVNLTTKDSETALHSAAQYGHAAVVAQLLEHGCDPSIRNSREETALDLAAQYGRLETVELLVRTHPELTEPFRRSVPGIVFPHTPLHLASRNGHKPVVEVLLAAGLNVNIRTPAGTALHEAALCGKVEVVRTLLDHGVDLSIRDSHHNTVMDLLSQFPVHVTHDITNLIKRHNGSHGGESDTEDRESLSQALPPIPVPDSTLGSPYENVRPSSRGRSRTGQSVSPSTSPSRWDFYRQSKSVDDVIEDRRRSGASALSIRRNSLTSKKLHETPIPYFQSLRVKRQGVTNFGASAFDSITFMFSHKCTMDRIEAEIKNIQSTKANSIPNLPQKFSNNIPYPVNHSVETMSKMYNSYRSSDNSFYQTPPVPKSFMDPCFHSSEEYSSYRQRDSDQISVSSTASSTGGPIHRDRDHFHADSSSGIYLPMTPRSTAHSPGSNNKVSPTPPKKPPRRNLSVSPTHLTPMSMSVEGNGINNHAYEYLFLARSGARSQGDLEEVGTRHLQHGRSIDTYVEMNKRFSIAPQDLHRGRSEELLDDHYNEQPSRRTNHQPVAITAMYENVAIKTQNPRRKLRRHHDVYENVELRHYDPTVTSSSVPNIIENVRLSTFVSNAYITLKSSEESLLDDNMSMQASNKNLKRLQNTQTPLSPTHYKQPPTPEHPPPSAQQAENAIHERIRPLSQEYKRRSRDIETETDEDLLSFPALDESSASLSSSISLSDKSISTDNNVEEYVCDVPFAGLFKGSTTALDGLDLPRPIPAERPKTLRRLKNVYDDTNLNGNDSSRHQDVSPQTNFVQKRNSSSRNNSSSSTSSSSNNDKDKSLSILSPFDEQEEWAKISEIMASIGTGLVRESVFVTELEQEFQARLGLSCSQNSLSTASLTPVGQWLNNLGYTEYEPLFINSGFDDIEFINGVLNEIDLREMGITNERDRSAILDAAKHLPCKIKEQVHHNNNMNEPIESVDQWLQRIHLSNYAETFSKHLYQDMDKVRRVWGCELTAVLEIQKPGHRKRILQSVGTNDTRSGPSLDEINADLNNLAKDIFQLKDEIRETPPNPPQAVSTPPVTTPPIPHPPTAAPGTLRHRKKSKPAPPPPTAKPAPDLEIRAPSELLVGVPATLKTQWRHPPISLVKGSVTYIANYLGSTHVKELRGTESTKKSIQTLKKSTSKDNRSTPDIILSISYQGVKFLNASTKEMICEHEIRNIHCACQDSDDLTHFAYITKDHKTNNHFCHVFCVQTMDQATEVILTLGQAFEVAYQMVLREQQITNRGHTRSHSANQIAGSLSPGPGGKSFSSSNGVSPSTVTHARSHSVNEIKLNGHQLSLAPLSLSTEDFSRTNNSNLELQ